MLFVYQTERVEMIVSDSALNRHPCAPAISALLRHLAATVPTTKGTSTVGGITASVSAGGTDVGDSEEAAAPAWLEALCNALCNAKQNVRWLLAQVSILSACVLIPIIIIRHPHTSTLTDKLLHASTCYPRLSRYHRST